MGANGKAALLPHRKTRGVNGFSGGAGKSENVGRVMRALNAGYAETRSELAGLLGLDKSTMTYIIGRLLEMGVIEEAEQGEASRRGGRKPVRLAIRNDRILAGGIELVGTGYNAIVLDNAGSIRLRISDDVPDARDPAASLSTAYTALTDAAAAEDLPLFAVGAAVSGIVDPRSGRLIRSDALELSDVELANVTRAEHTGAGAPPLIVENDANCGAWGELHTREHTGADFVYALARYTGEYLGIGFGVAIDGTIYYGRRFRTGEFASAWSTRSRVTQFGIPREQLVRAESDPTVFRAVVAEFLRSLAPVLALLDPERFVLGGVFRDRVATVSELLATDLRDSYTALVAEQIPFHAPIWGADELVAGAASMAIEKLFAAPRAAIDENGNRNGDPISWEHLFAAVGVSA